MARRDRKADERRLHALQEFIAEDAARRGRPTPPPLPPTRPTLTQLVEPWTQAAKKAAEDPLKTVVVGIFTIKVIAAVLFVLVVAVGVVYTVVAGT
ncbi:hypothetical protein [Streptomyces sp. NPDC051219]|uniref:hypothetical protein n=1 Tax=Streptomyces sp. NPDC051219 TaxID=3155283 RepID=UPI003443DDD9